MTFKFSSKGEDSGEISSSFSKLEKEFQSILSDLSSDENLERFKSEYQQLYQALVDSSLNEKQLRQKIHSLHEQLLRNATRVHKAIDLSKVDQETIKELKNEIEKAWKMVEIAQEKEEISKRTIESLSSEISKLSHMMSVDAEYGRTSSVTMEELYQNKADLQREHQELTDAKSVVQKDINKAKNNLVSVQKKISEVNRDVKRVERENDLKKQEYQKQIEERENVEMEIQFRAEAIENLEADVGHFSDEIGKIKKKEVEVVRKRRLKLGETLDLKKKCDKEVEKKESFQRELNFLVRQRSNLEATREELLGNFHNVAQFMSEKNKEKSKMVVIIQQLEKRMRSFNERIPKLEQEGEKLRKRMDRLSGRDIKKYKIKINLMRKEIDRRQYHKNLLEGRCSKVERSENTIKRRNMMIKNSKLNIEKVFQKTKIDAEKYRMMIFEIEKEVAALRCQEKETSIQLNREKDITGGLKEKNCDLQECLYENEKKMKHQSEMFERVRKERNFYSKMFVQAQEHIEKMKHKFRILYKQIRQLKMEIHQTEKIHFENSKELESMQSLKTLIKEKRDILEKEISKKKFELIRVKEEIKKWNEKLLIKIKEIEIQEKDINAVFKDRDILGTKIIKRDQEIDNCYEKIKIQQQFLMLGKRNYRERVREISILGSKLRIVQQRLVQMEHYKEFLGTIDTRINSFDKQLYLERMRMNILKQELGSKINVHRWRYLEGVDPQKFEMINRLNVLQRRLIEKGKMIKKKNEKVEKKNVVIEELKKVMTRNPGNEIYHQLDMFEKTSSEKVEQLKDMKTSLTEQRKEIKKLNNEIRRINRMIYQLKKRFFSEKKIVIDFVSAEKKMGKGRFKPSVNQSMIMYRPPIRTGGGFTIF